MNHIDPDQPKIPSALDNWHIADNLNEVRCQVCRGEGKLYVEHADGSPASEQVCPYCKGSKTSVWVKERFDFHFLKVDTVKMCIYFFGGLMLWPFPFWSHNAGIKVFHFGLCLVFAAGLVWMYMNPSPKKKKNRKVRQPNPLTTDRERLMGGAVVAGAVLKAQYDHRHHQQQQQQPQQQQQGGSNYTGTGPNGPSPNNWW